MYSFFSFSHFYSIDWSKVLFTVHYYRWWVEQIFLQLFSCLKFNSGKRLSNDCLLPINERSFHLSSSSLKLVATGAYYMPTLLIYNLFFSHRNHCATRISISALSLCYFDNAISQLILKRSNHLMATIKFSFS